jgi:hypothetical protein
MLSWFPELIWRSLPTRDQLPVAHGQTLEIADTTLASPNGGGEADVLNEILWQGRSFRADFNHDCLGGDLAIHFPSPMPLGMTPSDTAVMDWHIARDRGGHFRAGPAVLVLDILLGGHKVAGYVAKTLAKNGIHGLVLHMPQNGRRRVAGREYDWSMFLPSLRQAAADARRCRDVIAALPLVNGKIGIQGTSLGGFVATLAGAMDGAFDVVFLALTGGDTYGVLTKGKYDAARVRQHLLTAGYNDHKLRDWLWRIEPLRVAHRLDPRHTWLFSARFDNVVPRSNSRRLAAAIGLDHRHHRQLIGGHYSCALDARRFLSELVGAFRPPLSLA